MTGHKDDSHEGGCRCGKVDFRSSPSHWSRWHAIARDANEWQLVLFHWVLFIPPIFFKFTSGEPVIGGMHGADHHYFCPHCMSWLFTRLNGADELVNVRATMMDDVESYEPFIETYTSEMLPWATTPATHSFEKFPPMEMFRSLLGEFEKTKVWSLAIGWIEIPHTFKTDVFFKGDDHCLVGED